MRLATIAALSEQSRRHQGTLHPLAAIPMDAARLPSHALRLICLV